MPKSTVEEGGGQGTGDGGAWGYGVWPTGSSQLVNAWSSRLSREASAHGPWTASAVAELSPPPPSDHGWLGRSSARRNASRASHAQDTAVQGVLDLHR